jgi:predicted membrane protein
METEDQRQNAPQDFVNMEKDYYKESKNAISGRVLAGVLIITVGLLIFADRSGMLLLPDWLISWPMILIVIGSYLGIRHGFRGPAWIIMLLIGGIFLTGQINDDLDFKNYLLPLIVIAVGVTILFRPQKKSRERWRKSWDMRSGTTNENTMVTPITTVAAATNVRPTSDDFLDTVTVFGGVKKNIISKTFQGGEITTFFGGTELNLMQADIINGRIVIDITQVFGGTKLIVPSNWRIKSDDLVAIFGGLDDKRPVQPNVTSDSDKILVLRGTCIFGGIDIRSY